jgi:uncharacterized ferritin-like protein (DUF455 family)
MELREWALRIFSADTLEEKLVLPEGGLKSLTDREPGTAVPWSRPPRSGKIQVAPKGKRIKFPKPRSLQQKDMRVRCLHAFANHELMALEMMAWALLAFPEADKNFRKGLSSVLMDEQRHFALYSQRLEKMGTNFGDLPINDHFWRAAKDISNPLEWVCLMHLTFEQANLDHAPFFARQFRGVEDEESAQLMDVIFKDEIGHVRFGSHWLKESQSEYESLFCAFLENCSTQNMPDRARGLDFQEQARRDAGLDDDFIEAVRAWQPDD